VPATSNPSLHALVSGLPVASAIPALTRALQTGASAVLVAPPGAGKTTTVPLLLLEADWLDGGRILLLEPRRLAARAAASRMAWTLGERVGETVGWRMRGDTRVSKATRIEVITEGVLTRMLLDDPTLTSVGLICFDEFHERSLHGDVGLALALQTQALLRPELRLLVMSATIDGARVATLLGDAPVITSEGRSFPVTTSFAPPRDGQRMEDAAVSATLTALREHDGDVLVFLPGAREIRGAASLLSAQCDAAVDVWPLFGALDARDQDAAIAPSPPGRRKVVIASAIAETSLTIEGVRVVIDGGWSRVARYAARTGMSRLETVRVTRASADQRRGRAGRVAPGHCIRCWHQHDDAALRAFNTPEILDADLTPLALDLAGAGVINPDDLRWLDTPPAAAFTLGRELLRELGALDADGRITSHGSAMAELGVHPRLTYMLLCARDRGTVALACDLAAVLDDRDPIRALDARHADPDITLRLDALRSGRRALPSGFVPDDAVLTRCRETAAALRQRMQIANAARSTASVDNPDEIGALVALAYPDRVAKQRAGDSSRYLLRHGGGATLRDRASALAREEWLVCAALSDSGRDAAVQLATPVSERVIRELFAEQLTVTQSLIVDPETGRVRATEVESLGAIVLRERVNTSLTGAERATALLDFLRRDWPASMPWSDAAIRLRARLAFLHLHDPRWPDVSDVALGASIEQWLAPALEQCANVGAIAQLNLHDALLEMVEWTLRSQLDRLAPTHATVPTGSRIPIDYTDSAAPSLSVRLQELFGARETPAVLDGRVPLVVNLLSPAHRPVQVTRDLPGFWRTSYADVRKELRGRYPRHSWPEDPTTATPTSRAKPRGT
jgi:ATP-dependent helicase HrpB